VSVHSDVGRCLINTQSNGLDVVDVGSSLNRPSSVDSKSLPVDNYLIYSRNSDSDVVLHSDVGTSASNHCDIGSSLNRPSSVDSKSLPGSNSLNYAQNSSSDVVLHSDVGTSASDHSDVGSSLNKSRNNSLDVSVHSDVGSCLNRPLSVDSNSVPDVNSPINARNRSPDVSVSSEVGSSLNRPSCSHSKSLPANYYWTVGGGGTDSESDGGTDSESDSSELEEHFINPKSKNKQSKGKSKSEPKMPVLKPQVPLPLAPKRKIKPS